MQGWIALHRPVILHRGVTEDEEKAVGPSKEVAGGTTGRDEPGFLGIPSPGQWHRAVLRSIPFLGQCSAVLVLGTLIDF